MARLNEPAVAPVPPADTAAIQRLCPLKDDAIKRKFLRQNRELARVNSQQSIRIRSLENDASRLMTENLSLREQVLSLQAFLDAGANVRSTGQIDIVKSKLEVKILELTGLVEELKDVGKRERTLPKHAPQPTRARRTQEERQCVKSLLLAPENATMPTIVEDKLYPRRTLQTSAERSSMSSTSSQSPEIGSPPVSRLAEESVVYHPLSPSLQLSTGAERGAEVKSQCDWAGRRQRRKSTTSLNDHRSPVHFDPLEGQEMVVQMLVRPSTKRKFSVQQDDEEARPSKAFPEACRGFPADSVKLSTPSQLISSERSVLCEKPVNADPSGLPKRTHVTDVGLLAKQMMNTAPEVLKVRNTGKRMLRGHSADDRVETLTSEVHCDNLLPKTPAIEAILSPPSTVSTASQNISEDTPPPGDLTVNARLDTNSRPCRRTRPQVSYKEPSLHTKMRRPGKEMVDAVGSQHRSRSAITSEPNSGPDHELSVKSKDIQTRRLSSTISLPIKDEERLAGSPLREKLNRIDAAGDTRSNAPKLNSIAASDAISALIHENRRKSANFGVLHDTTTYQDLSKDEDVADLAIFDFEESSLPETQIDPPVQTHADFAGVVRSARRHSSAPASSVGKVAVVAVADRRMRAMRSKLSHSTNDATRISSIQTQSSREEAYSRTCQSHNLPVEAFTSNIIDPRVRSEHARDTTKNGGSKAQQTASRRRSMML